MMPFFHIAAEEHGPIAIEVVKGAWVNRMPPILRGETMENYTDRLIGARGPDLMPYDHRRYRQCSIGFHEECSDPEGEQCQCWCHTEEE